MRYDIIGIREFAEMLTREGGLTAGGTLSNRKALEGARLHRHIQKRLAAEHDDFQAEKAVLYTVNRELLTGHDDQELSSITFDSLPEPEEFTLEGRIDGIYKDGDVTVICEIKSAEEHPAAAAPAHILQAAVYAFIESRGLFNDAKIRIEIIYGLYSDHDFLRVFSFDETAESVSGLVKPHAVRYGRFVRFNNEHNARLQEQLAALPFIFSDFREGQRRLSVNVFNTLNSADCSVLLCQAPTGIGKTAGTLYPALKAMRFTDGEKSAIFYFTARGEGARPPAEALSLAADSVPELRYCILTAKEKMCSFEGARGIDGAEREFRCDPVNCAAGREHYDRVDAAIGEALGSDARCFDLTFVRTLARKHCVCPFELMLDLSEFCDVIICDYNYLFDPESYLRRYFEGKGGQYYFLIDEAHQLPDRVRSMYSASLCADDLERAARGKKRKRIGKICVRTAQVFEDIFEQGTDPMLTDSVLTDPVSAGTDQAETTPENRFPKTFLSQLEQFCDAATEYLENSEDETLRLLYFDVLHFMRMHELAASGGFNLRMTGESGHRTASVVCIDPAKIIPGKCALAKGTVLFSGSLLPAPFYADQLGFPDAPFVQFESPFPRENLLVLSATGYDTRYKYRAGSYGRLASFIERLGTALGKGNYIVYFNSYSYLRSVLELLSESFRDRYVVEQPRGADTALRKEFLDGFRPEPDTLHIGFCVLGGNFSEGVDLPGSRLSGTVIVGTGLPQVGDNTELIRAYYDFLEPGSGYNNAYFYPGINKVIQAAGRVIRTGSDRGFVLLIDRRYRFSDHMNALPYSWRPEYSADEQKIIDRIVAFISEI